MSLSAKARRIRAVVLDVDGVMTDGRIGYGAAEDIKFFHVRDGHGIRMLRQGAIRVGFLSARTSAANRRRAQELGMDFVLEGESDKAVAFARLLVEQNLRAEECLCVGDDVIDLPVLRQAGISVAVADAAPEVRQRVDMVTTAPGGTGAVREVAEWLLKEQGKWDELMAKYLV